MQTFKAATTQVDVQYRDLSHNLDAHVRLIAEAANAGCQLILFPELGTTGHNATPEIARFAEEADGPIYRLMHEQARKHKIVVSYGFMEKHRGTHYNSQALVGPEGRIGIQRKVHASYDEFFRFRQAYTWEVFDVGFAKIGTAICHDSDFWESWRILALKGAEVILLPHAIRKMIDPDGHLTFDGHEHQASEEEFIANQRELFEARPNPKLHDVQARTNGVYALFSDQVGFDGHSSHAGGAFILNPEGKMIAHTEPGLGDAWTCAELDPEIFERVRQNPWFPLKKRRPETYGELTKLE